MAPYLLTNLPSERQTAAKPSEDIADDDVRRAVNRTIHTLKNADRETPRPIHTARLLYMILDNERFLNIEKLNERCDRTGRFSGACAPVAITSAVKNPYGMLHFGLPILG